VNADNGDRQANSAGIMAMLEKIRKVRALAWQQYAVAFSAFAGISLVNLWLEPWIGYQTIPLIYLLAIVLLALFVGRGPLLFGTALTAVGWNFLFVPPMYSLHIGGFYDKAMFATYFVVAFTIGHLTVRARAQRAAELKAQLLAESERLGRTLLNSVSHELRTPIAAITSAASGLRVSGSLDAVQQRLANEIEAASARLNRVVESLLSAARIQSGQLKPRLEWCDPPDVIHAALEETKEVTAGHPIEVKIANDLPLVKLDFELMEQALANLVVNAATHTPPGTPIELTARIEEKNLIVQVADNGPGVPADHLQDIFDLFHRAPNAKPGGTGLGLAVVKGFVDVQGGRVQAANRMHGGAVFSIFLPATEAPALVEEKP
jgi:two-component system sensor histidine kinase KdpD